VFSVIKIIVDFQQKLSFVIQLVSVENKKEVFSGKIKVLLKIIIGVLFGSETSYIP